MPRKGTKGCPPELRPFLWKKGQSGNPAGPRPRMSFESHVARILDEAVPGADVSKREALARIFVNAMFNRNGQMIREYLAREWPVVQHHEVELPSVEPAALETAFDRLFAGEEASVPAKPNGNGAA